VTPAYWITGVIYAQGARRAFFIGGLAGGAVPFLGLVIYSLALGIDFVEDFGRGRGFRGFYGEYQLMNLMASLLIFAPVALAFIGGWIAYAVHYSLQPPAPKPRTESPFRQEFPAPIAPQPVEQVQLPTLR